MMKDEAEESISQSANVDASIPNVPAGLGEEESRTRLTGFMKSRGSFGDAVQTGLLGAGMGSQAAQGATNPLAAFIQGAAVGMQAPAQMYEQKRKQIQSVYDATPFGVTHKEITDKEPYNSLAGLPTALALKIIQGIAVDTAKIKATGEEQRLTEQAKSESETINKIEDATSYARLANQSYGLIGEDEIKPEDLIGMRKGDVDNMIKSHAGKSIAEGFNPSAVKESAPGTLASEYGLPMERPNPYYNMPQKVYDKVRVANSTLATKTIDKMVQSASAMDQVSNSLVRAKQILDSGLQTGPISGRIPGRKLGADAQEFDQIASTILPSMRQGMPGAVSDRDMQIFRDANFGLTKDESLNRKVINQSLAIATRVKDKAEFMANWATVYGDINGAESAWAKYIKANPLFSLSGDINPTVKTYQEYFNPSSGTWDEGKEKRLAELRKRVGK